MAKLRSVNTHFWDDTFIINLDPDGKLLFLYFLTSPLANIAGAYEINLRRVAFDTGIAVEKIQGILAQFETADKMIYRDGWILIKNFIKNQSLNPKITAGIESALKCCPDWIKHRVSIDYPSLSIAFDNLNINSNSNKKGNINADADNLSSTAAPIEPEESLNPLDSEIENYLTAVKEAYGTSVLSREDRWFDSVGKAITAEIKIEAYIAALKILLKDQNPKYPITPENVLTAAIEQRARLQPKSTAPEKPQYSDRNAEMEARGFPKMPIANAGGLH